MSLLIVSETHLLHLTTQVYHPIGGMSNKKYNFFKKIFIFLLFIIFCYYLPKWRRTKRSIFAIAFSKLAIE